MTKQDFLDKLKQQINHLPQKDYQEIIDHFTEYFDEAGPDHEQAILKELGNPEDIAKELLKALDLPEKTDEDDWTNWEIDNKTRSESNSQELEPIVDIRYSLLNHDLTIEAADIPYPTISYDDNRITISQDSAGMLNIIEDSAVQTIQYGFHFLDRWLAKYQPITLTLPVNHHLKKISGESDNNDVTIRHIHCDSIVSNTYNGTISISHLSDSTVNLSSKNGNIILEHCHIQSSKCQAKNANLSCDNSTLINCQLSNNNGNIRLEASQLTETSIENKNGNIIGQQLAFSNDITIINKNGIIDINCPRENLSYYDVKTSNNNGFVTISQEAGRQTPFKAQLTISNNNGLISVN